MRFVNSCFEVMIMDILCLVIKMRKSGFTLVEAIAGMGLLTLMVTISTIPLISYIDKTNQQRAIIETRTVVLTAHLTLYEKLGETSNLNDNSLINEIIKIADVDGQIIKIDGEGNEISYLHYRSNDNIDVIYDVKENDKIRINE